MSVRTVSVFLKMNVADAKVQLNSASKSLEDLAAKADKTGKVAQTGMGRMVQSAQLQRQAWSTVSTGLLATSAAATAMVGVAVKKFADFDAAMSSVQAATHESAANMELLRSAAIEAGADTQYSATEAAGAIEELAKAGISTADILSGGLSGALNLAAAGSMDVGDAAEIAATALTQFKLKGSDVGHVADLLAAGAGKAQGDVTDLGMALKQSGLVASQTGLSIEETTGALSAFASAGLIGSDAGTSFKSMLQRLTPQSKEAQTLMDQLGISAYDAQGKFIGLTAFAGNLHDSLKGLTDQQRNSAMATIFGSDAVRAAAVLYDQGADGVAKWQAAVDDSGFAAETAAARTDNLKGDIERLGGSLETVFIKSGSGANGALRGLVQGVEDAVDAFGRLPEPVQQGALWLTALTAAGAGFVGVGMKVVTSAMDMATSLSDLGIVSGRTAGRVKGVVTSLGKIGGTAGLILGVAEAAGHLFAAFDKQKASGLEATTKALISLSDAKLDSLFNFSAGGAEVNDLSDALNVLLGSGFDDKLWRLNSSLNGFVGISDTVGDTRDQFDAVDQSLSQLVSGGNSELAEQIFQRIADAADEQGISIDRVKELFPEYAEAIDGASNAQELQGDATADATSAVEDQASALHELIKAQSEAAGNALSLSDAQMGYESALQAATDAIAENGQTLDITTDAGRKNRSALDDIASSGWDLISSLDAVGTSQDDLQASMGRTREDFIKTAVQMGMTQAAAEALANQYGLIPDQVTTSVSETGTTPTKTAIQSVIDKINGVPSSKVVGISAIDNASSKITQIQSLINSLQNKTVVVGVSSPSALAAAGHATGGAITGPGTGTSDDILMWASNGEHMATAYEVDRAGGQSAWYALRAAVRRDGADAVRRAVGAPGYASGGAVPREARVTPSYMSQPSVNVSAPSLEGLALTGSLNVNGVLVPLVDARIERQQKRFARGPR